MIPLKLTLSGFMSYNHEQTLTFEDDSLWVLVGKNASGKSSVFDAIIFVLFGETRVRGIPNGELVNHSSDSAQITFDFAVGSTKYRVKRTIDKKGSTTRQASVLLAKPDGSLSPQPIPLTHKEKEFKNWIENDIGLNYEVFITSVLLRQGKADAFLEAGTDTRYEVLSKLIDLAKYTTLETKARDNKKLWEAQASFHRDNLNRMSPVTDQDLTDAQTTIEHEDIAVQTSQHLAEDLRILFGQASQWEHLNTDMLDIGSKIQAHQILLNRANEINSCYQRLVDLRRVLPGLKAIVELAQAIRLEDTAISRLSNEWRDDEQLIRAAEPSIAELDAHHKQRAERARDIASESTQLYRRLNELSSTMSLIDQIEKLGEKLEQFRIALIEYPENLDGLLKDSETRRDEALEAQQVLPSLTRLGTEKTKLAEAEQLRRRLSQQLADKKLERPVVFQAQENAQVTFKEAETHEKNMRDALTKANTHLSAAHLQLDNFNQVVGSAKCQYCGSDLTEHHKADEHQRLTDELKKKEELAASAKDNHNRAVQGLGKADKLRRNTSEDFIRLDAEIGSITQSLRTCEQNIEERLAAIEMTYDALPVAYQVKIYLTKPTSVDTWTESVYPQSSDLQALKATVAQIAAYRAEATRLSNQVGNRDRTQTLWKNTHETLLAAQKTLPANWEDLRAEHFRLKNSEEDLASRLETAQRDEKDASDALEKATKELQAIRDRQSRRSGVLETSRTELQRKRESITVKIAQLPDGWRDEADTITEEQLSSLTKEMNALLEYDDLYQKLNVADQTLQDLRLHEAEIQGKINDLPEKAHRPATEIDQELSDALETSRNAEGRLSQARTRYGQLLTQREQYKETEACLKAAARKAYLYSILCDQFGEKGIQKAIINRAEVAIVHLSNQMLDNLSGGRSKLRLREAGGNKKALDLEVWDAQTGGDKPILASLASGSQRFRIAISLALGIGQYIGNESSRIESVIIDEGFGSLDREGRESIIQELYSLSRHLKRVILVSHQEEFSKGFQTGYEIYLHNGASQVRPLAQ